VKSAAVWIRWVSVVAISATVSACGDGKSDDASSSGDDAASGAGSDVGGGPSAGGTGGTPSGAAGNGAATTNDGQGGGGGTIGSGGASAGTGAGGGTTGGGGFGGEGGVEAGGAASTGGSGATTPATGGEGGAGLGGATPSTGGAGGDPESGGAGADASGGTTPGQGGQAPSAGGSAGEPGSGGQGTGGEPQPGLGCEATSHPETGYQSIDVAGTERRYYLIAAEVTEPVPLFIGFHGYGGTGEGDQWTFDLQGHAEGRAVLMFPDGVAQDWYGGAVGWDTRGDDTPDIALVQALIDAAKAEHCIDTSRIFVVGFSWGGWMAAQSACVLGDQLRGFASVAGGGPMGVTNCQGPLSGIIMHGSADSAEPISSGEATRDRFQGLNECQTSSEPVASDHCVAYAGCAAPLWWCEHPGEHEMPDWASDVVWDFFQNAP
jgi:polyhydroxybutyrate depolymerase